MPYFEPFSKPVEEEFIVGGRVPDMHGVRLFTRCIFFLIWNSPTEPAAYRDWLRYVGRGMAGGWWPR